MGEPKANTPNAPSVAPPNSGPQVDPLLGRTINERFKILSLIARGGMGKVYKAEQAPLGRLVALKVLHPNYNGEHDPEFHKRFFLEASTSSKLRHPNTVTIFDYGTTDDGVYYMAMELLEGRTLHRVLREAGKLPYDRALRIVKQMCRSLREAHGIGVIHRDLKPANVFLVRNEDDEDFVKVLDFGLVKQLDETGTDHLTQTGLFMGSPKYMAPEQIRGERVTESTDVYALGVVLFEMLTGKVPFDRGNSVNTLMAHVSDPVPALNEFAPDVLIPVGVSDLVYKCLQKRPEDRYPTMDALLDAIKFSTTGLMNSSLGTTGEFNASTSHPNQNIAAIHSAPPAANTSSDFPTTSGAKLVGSNSDLPPPHVTHSANSAAAVLPPTEPPSVLATSEQQSNSAAKARSRTPLIAGVVFVAMAGILGAIALKNNQGQGTTTQQTTGQNPATNTANNNTQTGSSQVPNTGSTPTPNGTPNTPQTNPTPTEPSVHIMLSSDPASVEVFEGTQSLGRTPLDLRLTGERGNPAVMHTFIFRQSGYLDTQVTLGGSEIRYAARLTRRPRQVPNNQNGHQVPTGYREW